MKELAAEIGYTVQAVCGWRRKFHDAPAADSKGRHDALRWREFVRKHGLNNTSIEPPDNPDPDADENLQTKDDLNRALLREKVRRERIKGDIESGDAVLVAEIEPHLGAILAALQTAMDSFPDRAAPMVRGFDDVAEISRILHSEMQTVIGSLSIFDFEHALDECPPEHRAEVEKAIRRIGQKTINHVTK